MSRQNLFEIISRFKTYSHEGSKSYDFKMLNTFVSGYETALLVHDINEVGSTFSKEFLGFLRRKYGHSAQGNTWYEVLHNTSSMESMSLDEFFVNLDEFERCTSDS